MTVMNNKPMLFVINNIIIIYLLIEKENTSLIKLMFYCTHL